MPAVRHIGNRYYIYDYEMPLPRVCAAVGCAQYNKIYDVPIY